MRIVVVDLGGLVAARLVERLEQRGHVAVAASPETGVDTITGEGLAQALAGASVVVDVSRAPSLADAAALERSDTSTRNLLAAEAAAGVGHHVALSVVGAQEELIRDSSIPYSILLAPRLLAVDDLADALGEICLGPP